MSVLAAAFERQANDARAAGDEQAGKAWSVLHQAVEDAVMEGARAAVDYLQDMITLTRFEENRANALQTIAKAQADYDEANVMLSKHRITSAVNAEPSSMADSLRPSASGDIGMTSPTKTRTKSGALNETSVALASCSALG